MKNKKILYLRLSWSRFWDYFGKWTNVTDTISYHIVISILQKIRILSILQIFPDHQYNLLYQMSGILPLVKELSGKIWLMILSRRIWRVPISISWMVLVLLLIFTMLYVLVITIIQQVLTVKIKRLILLRISRGLTRREETMLAFMKINRN